jgi:hypothetical protein
VGACFSRRPGFSQGGGMMASLSWAFPPLGGVVRVVGGALALAYDFPPYGGLAQYFGVSCGCRNGYDPCAGLVSSLRHPDGGSLCRRRV